MDCNCIQVTIKCDNCAHKMITYHNHWCAIICMKCKTKT